jgi:hypothetical protein
MKPRSTKKSLRDTLRENQRGLDHYALLYGKPQTQHIAVKPKREIVNHTDKDQLEAAVVSESGDILKQHPRILFAVRQQGGMMYNPSGAPVWFYRIIRSPEEMKIVDFWGFTTDFKPFAFECKWRGWTKPTSKREFEQLAYMNMIANSGGIGRFVTCAEDVLEALA